MLNSLCLQVCSPAGFELSFDSCLRFLIARVPFAVTLRTRGTRKFSIWTTRYRSSLFFGFFSCVLSYLVCLCGYINADIAVVTVPLHIYSLVGICYRTSLGLTFIPRLLLALIWVSLPRRNCSFFYFRQLFSLTRFLFFCAAALCIWTAPSRSPAGNCFHLYAATDEVWVPVRKVRRGTRVL